MVELFAQVGQQVEALARPLETQAAALNELQARLAKTSANSSKPPSSDGYAKPKRTTSLRKPGQKPLGGQPGYRGDILERVATPDRTELHPVAAGVQCGTSLVDVVVTSHDERQVFDIPAIRIEVTAHRAEVKTCPGCGTENHGVFPVGVSGPVQYGPGVKTWATYFQTQHLVPVERTAQIIEDLTGQRVAEATLMKAQPAPGLAHQTAVGELFRQIANHLVGKPCRPFVAPFDVRLPRGNEADDEVTTVVQPDIAVICDPAKLDERGCRGAPDWVIEVLSPSTAAKDQIQKLAA